MKFLITGGAGFIGSAVIRHLINDRGHEVINIDKLTYSGNLDSLREVERNELYSFKEIDICDSDQVRRVIAGCRPNVVINLAAESSVDRSIVNPSKFIQTNIVGTFALLEEVRHYWINLRELKKINFGFFIFLRMRFLVLWVQLKSPSMKGVIIALIHLTLHRKLAPII